nr:HAD family hydrolase [Thaumasiovibrio subtropicus]
MKKPPYLAVFDLDETIIAADSSTLWAEYLVSNKNADPALVTEDQAKLRKSRHSKLDIKDYMRLTLAPLTGKSEQEISIWVNEFIEESIIPAIYPGALERLEWHRRRGDQILLVSASGEHIVEPIAKRLDIEHVLAIQLEKHQGVYTGNTIGTISYQKGKVARMKAWINAQPEQFRGCYGYSDSINDLPLLEVVDRPFAINPDPALALHAQMQEWTIMEWQHENNILR